MGYEILKIGSFIKMDSQGFFINDYEVNKLMIPYEKAIDKIIGCYITVFKENVHSIYIRGSVARGNPIMGFSDYDCLAVLCKKCTDIEKKSILEYAESLKLEFDFVPIFDLSYCDIIELMENEEARHWQFAIKVQSICIYGKSLIPILPKFKPNSEIIFSLSCLEKSINKSRNVFLKAFDPDIIKRRCAWIMRIFVRCGLLLVVEREKKYTNELALCCEVFSQYYPEKAKQMKISLELAINPITNLEVLLDLLDNLGQWLVRERIFIYGI